MNNYYLSPHLSWREFTATQHRQFLEQQDNPPDEVIIRAKNFALTVFEPARELVGPLLISSGYRCPELNATVGSLETSAHPVGTAVDCYPLKMGLREAYITIAYSEVPYDQLIYEYGRWIHLGGAKIEGTPPRRERFMIFEPGRYLIFDEKDPRVI